MNSVLPATSIRPPSARRSVVPVILSGGSGTRLWPVSRESFPKQFWPLVTERSMIQETALRAVGEGFAPPVVVCNHEHRFMVAEQLRAAGVEGARIVLEPIGRNSAPAITAAALLVAVDDPRAVLWMMAADAAIGDVPALHRALDRAVAAAQAGRVVTFGMRPTGPETGYGYIEVGAELREEDGRPIAGVHDLARFVEKPDAAEAARLVATGRHLWNSGMFVFTAETLLEEMQAHAPEVLAAVRRAMEGATRDLDFIRLAPEAFAACPAISLDYAVAERTHRAAVVPAELPWSDVGSWSALWELGAKDPAGNVAVGDVLLADARRCYVRSDGIATAVLGLQDAVVVVTEDAVLAMHRDRAQDVKKIVDRLRAVGRREALAHNRTYQPWGFHETLIEGHRFKVTWVLVKPGHGMSMQKHFHRAEHWVVVQGSALVTRDDEQLLVRENESVYLPLGSMHRVENPGRIPLTLVEVQSGSYLGEDDVVRLETAASSSLA